MANFILRQRTAPSKRGTETSFRFVAAKGAVIPVAPPVPATTTPDPFKEGAAVLFQRDGTTLAGVVSKNANCANGKVALRLAIPDENGLLMASQTIVELDRSDLTPCDAPHVDRKMVVWETNEPLIHDSIKAVTIKDPHTGAVLDYRDVYFSGYGSTFANITPKDRDGDTVQSGAFTETLRDFRRNPVMLVDHYNKCECLMGSYTEVMQDDLGLKVTGRVTNSPTEDAKHIRFLIMEGHLKTLSMGGIFIYGVDQRTIEKVHLFEVSLIPIPSNPDALFQARGLDIDSAVKMFQRRVSKAV